VRRFKVEETVTLIDQRLQQIFREAFENDTLTLADSLSPEIMPEWDSLGHVKLIMGCEEEFGVKFTIEETVESNSVAQLKSVLASKGVGR
jgi:acyl carrier protein